MSNDPAGPQFVEICDADTGERVKKVGLCGADALGRSLGASAERAAGGHGDHRTATSAAAFRESWAHNPEHARPVGRQPA
ncbi:hypothetical protein [Streptomyces phaeochromogenes]|uniref:hypothetical protein n=1 Tax=Streptomyces phaeochromogenes TaxID=1923 RepID=UPI002E1597CD|nr:hypothetical protein OG437_00040 [Streptomyces phaeochromogenes]WSJ11347.1 hypothetical protein OG437_50860 [Streptomyces phaeochromogenes]